jgi:hypothetical protein
VTSFTSIWANFQLPEVWREPLPGTTLTYFDQRYDF